MKDDLKHHKPPSIDGDTASNQSSLVHTNQSSFRKSHENAQKTRKYLESIFRDKQAQITKDTADKIRTLINGLLDKNTRLFTDVCKLKLKIVRDKASLSPSETELQNKITKLEEQNKSLESTRQKLHGTELMVARLQGQIDENRTGNRELVPIFYKWIKKKMSFLKWKKKLKINNNN